MSFLSRTVAPGCLGLLLLFAAPPASASYELPVCQTIASSPGVDPAVKAAQLAHCDRVEAAVEAFLHEAPLHGISEEDAYWFVMLFVAPAHWQMLAEIDFAASCGNGTCDPGEVVDICPQDCFGGSGGGGAGTSDGGPPGGPGGSL